MRIAIADDSGLFRSGLSSLMRAAGCDVLHEASDGDELLALVDAEPPDAVILDIRMPPTFTDEGVQVAEILKTRHPHVGVLVLSTYDETSYAVRLLKDRKYGIGYLLKDRVDDVRNLFDALDRVSAGQAVIDPSIVARLIEQHARASQLDVLSDREREVLRHMAEGRSNAGIGQKLFLSQRTVEAHVGNVFTKLNIPSQNDANRRVLAVLAWLRSTTAP